MENKTAVEWLIEQLEQELSDDMEVTSEIWVSVKKQALEMEEQQIKDAFDNGAENEYDNNRGHSLKITSHEYYSETYPIQF